MFSNRGQDQPLTKVSDISKVLNIFLKATGPIKIIFNGAMGPLIFMVRN